MKKQIIYPTLFLSLLCLLCASCTIKEDVNIEINERPALNLSYQYIDKNGKIDMQDVETLNVAIINSNNTVIKEEVILREQMNNYRPLYGVPEGEYTVVSFGNADSANIYTKANVYHTALNPNKTYTTTDRLFISRQKFTVRRGVPVLDTAYLDKLYYDVDLQIKGLRALHNTSISDFIVHIDGTPLGFTQSKVPIEQMRITPFLQFNMNDVTTSKLYVHRFDDAAKVTLTLMYRDEILANFPLSDYLNDRRAGIDLHNGKDVTIPLELDITSAGVKIIINDWQAAEIQWSSVGD